MSNDYGIRDLRHAMHQSESVQATASIWEPTQSTSQARNVDLEPATAARLAEVFAAPAPDAPTHLLAHEMKEAAIRAELARLTPLESFLVKRRLERAVDESLVRAFRRLAPPRQARLLAFLADARRRAAVTASR